MRLFHGLKILSLSAVLILTACAAFEPQQEDAFSRPSQSSDTMSNAAMADRDYSEYMSSDHVRVYSLDGPASFDTQDESSVIYGGGQGGYAYGGDSRVIVYGLDDARLYTGGQRVGAVSFDEGPESFDRPVPVPAKSAASGALLGKVYFPHDSSSLDGNDEALIEQVVAQAARNPAATVVVEGHASRRAATHNRTDRQLVNLKTSLDRAYQVSRALVKKGVPAESVRTVGLGDTQAEASEEASRRVEIYQSAQR